jgi:peptidoglycan/xylan/chitin deacetylase (PgdA/CDA1 family)
MPAYVEQYQCELRLPVYLTFDDGPHLRVTRRILQVLREERAKATFFIVGNRLKEPGAL